jgi:quinol monooxygenase YgiN
MSDSFVMVATAVPKEGEAEMLQRAWLEAIPAFHEEEGCLFYAFHVRNDGAFVTIEKWASTEALETHLASPVMQRLRNQIVDNILTSSTQTLQAMPIGELALGAV